MVLLKSLMDPLMIPMMDLLWFHNKKLYLACLMVLMKVKLMVLLRVPIIGLLWFHKWKLYLAP